MLNFVSAFLLLENTSFDLYCFHVQAEVAGGGDATPQLSEAAQSELLEMCEEQFTYLEKVNALFNTISCRSTLNLTMRWMYLKIRNLRLRVCVSLCCSFRMRLFSLNQIFVRINRNR